MKKWPFHIWSVCAFCSGTGHFKMLSLTEIIDHLSFIYMVVWNMFVSFLILSHKLTSVVWCGKGVSFSVNPLPTKSYRTSQCCKHSLHPILTPATVLALVGSMDSKQDCWAGCQHLYCSELYCCNSENRSVTILQFVLKKEGLF